MRNVLVCVVVVLVAGISGCKSSQERSLREFLSVLNQITDLLNTITDGRSAEKAKSKLRKLFVRLRESGYQLTRAEKKPGEGSEDLADKYRQEYEEALQRFRKAHAKASSDPEAGKVIYQLIDEEIPSIREP